MGRNTVDRGTSGGSAKRVRASPRANNRDFLAGGGELGALMRQMDWSTTKLGPIERWPQSLRTSVSLCLNSRFAIIIWWGPELIMLYNDAYRHMTLASKHPLALGNPGRDCWREIWDVIGPMLENVLNKGEATWSDDLCLILERHGYPEETYHTFSYSPIRDETGRVGGVFTPVSETTERVISERRLRTLRDLAARGADAKSEPQAWNVAAEVLAQNATDIPFAVLYRMDEQCRLASAAGYAGIGPDHPLCPPEFLVNKGQSPIACLFEQVLTAGKRVEFGRADELGVDLPGGTWGVGPRELILLPLLQTGQAGALGVLVAGVSRRKLLDESYRTFFNLVADQIAKAVADAQAYEQERRRAEALAEIDRAKTVFFSNVSHEFRTPLTLMLGPLEAMLERAGEPVVAGRDELELVHRNGMRLLKMVNTLLDFSRIEAGRAEAVYEETDLARLTTDIASVFRSTMERAGLRFIVDCPPLGEPAYVDRDMWEKIILNLISNAFKFTFEGSVSVTLKRVESGLELAVEDTGAGIPEGELPRIFGRFHRVDVTRGRTHEGTGIGLALVQELVKLHGGSIRVESTLGKGSRFTVSIPAGNAHLPQGRVGAARMLSSTAVSAAAYLEEASRWLPEPDRPGGSVRPFASDSVQAPHLETLGGRILLADDNADMRGYVRRLLSERYEVETVANGAEALAAVKRSKPDLILTDVMMPELDGFGLLRELRSSERASTIPVILLSARAGEDARIEGLEAGADDYIVKPFTARELLARVGAHLAMSRIRHEAAERERELHTEADLARERVISILESINDGFFAFDRDWHFVYVNAAAERLCGMQRERLAGTTLWAAYPELIGTRVESEYRRAMAERVPVQFENWYEPWQRWFDIRVNPAKDGGLAIFFQDITSRKRTEEAIREINAELRRANADLEQFAYSATHDLKEPLRMVKTYAQLFKRKYAGSLDSEGDEILGYCVQGATRMDALITDLLAYTTASAAADGAEEATDLERSLDAALANLHTAIEETGATITHDPLPRLKVSAVHSQQILQNLIGNAIKYRSEKPPEVHVGALKNGDEWVFSVRDNGIGIDPAYKDSVFGLFKRLHSSQQYAGTGIGLAICRKLVERYGGRIWVDSEPGKGATFSFTVPSHPQHVS